MTAKLSVSLSDDDLSYIDGLARVQSATRSAVIHDLVRIARELQSTRAYVSAFRDWEDDGDDEVWDAVAGDGLSGHSERSA